MAKQKKLDSALKDKETGLTDREKLFVVNYIKYNFNGRMALDAIDGEEHTPNGKYAAVHQLLRKPQVREAIRKEIDLQLDRIRDSVYKEIIEKCICIVTADISDYIAPDGSAMFSNWEEVDSRPVKTVKKIETEKSERWELELHDPQPYIDKLIKLMELAKPEVIDLNVMVNNADDLKNCTTEQLQKIINGKKKVVDK